MGFDPEAVVISAHARQRYAERRNTRPDFVEDGIRRQLRKAAAMPLVPLRVSAGRPARIYLVGELILVLDPTWRFLLTIIHKRRGVQTYHSAKRRKPNQRSERGRRREQA